MKNLKIKWCDATTDADFETLFSQWYPSLESFCWLPDKSDIRIDRLRIYLEKHLKLKQLETDWEFLWVNCDLFGETMIELDALIIHFNTMSADIGFVEFTSVIKTLYAHKFYRSLKLVRKQLINLSIELNR